VHQLLVALARLLACLIGRMDQTSCGVSPRESHHCCIGDQVLVWLFAHSPSHHKTGVDLDYSGKIEPPFSRFNACNIGQPRGYWWPQR
jgi:hypothetical protein